METEKSTESKDDKTEKVNLLNLKVAEMDASIKLLAKQIVENNGKVNTITEYQLEETKLRDFVVAGIQNEEYDVYRFHRMLGPNGGEIIK